MVLLTGSDVLGQPRGLATKSAFGLLFLAFIALSGLDAIDLGAFRHPPGHGQVADGKNFKLQVLPGLFTVDSGIPYKAIAHDPDVLIACDADMGLNFDEFDPNFSVLGGKVAGEEVQFFLLPVGQEGTWTSALANVFSRFLCFASGPDLRDVSHTPYLGRVAYELWLLGGFWKLTGQGRKRSGPRGCTSGARACEAGCTMQDEPQSQPFAAVWLV